ncbi:hypothetical protein HY733_02410 [Candidatus Uhrbacteria bacterium]|nr:hypothetical protein [Candidatus Uhrbacteria bacterium]
MTNSLRLKKAFTFVVAAATIVATAGLTAFVPSQASAAEYGDLIMGETLSTVYYYGSDGQRYSFPNEKTFFSWFEDFDDVVEITDEELADITLAGNIVYRPGSRWIKIESDEKTYAVAADGSIHWIESEEVAEGLAGDDWNTFIDDVPDVFFVDYTVGDSLTDASEGYEGMLWSDGTSTYLVWDGEVRMVSDDGFDANMFQDGFVLSGDGFDMDSLTEGDEIDSELALLTDAAQMVETEEYEETEYVEVSLSDDSPSSSTLVAGQGIAHLASYDFTNSSDDDVEVTSVQLTREGVSADTTLSNVYLFDGWVRLSDSATVSSGVITWNDSSGLFTIPAGETYTVAVRSDIASSTSGQTVGVSLDPDAVEYDGSNESTGSDISSDEHTIATVTNFGTVALATTTQPSSDGTPTPEDDFRVWENQMTIGNNEAWLHVVRFRSIGSIGADDLGNWRLYVAGVNYGDAVETQDDDGYVTFDLSEDPVEMNTGTHSVKVLADIWGGSTRTVTVGLRNTADAVFIEDDYDQPILITGNSTSTTATFAAHDSAAQTLASGDITFTKESDSTSGDVVRGASSASLGSFEVKATGEAMKIENLNIAIEEEDDGTNTDDDGDTAYTLRNGALYVDGTQVGSTAAIAGDADSTQAYTNYTFGSSFIVYPGSPVTLEIKADVYDSDGTNAFDTNAPDSLQVVIDAGAASSNVLRMTSGSYISRPSTDVTGNVLTVRTGTLTVANNTSYAAQSAVAPKTEYRVGSWTITANTTEDVNLTQFDIDFSTAASDASAAADYSSLYVTYGPEGDEEETSQKTSVSLTTNTWSLNYTLEAGETIYVNAYANVATSVSDDTDGDDIITADLDVDGTTADSATSIDGSDVSGSAITWYSAGTFSTALGGDTPVAKIVAAGQTVETAKYKFTAVRESYSIDQIQVAVDGSTDAIAQRAAGVISEVELYDGSTLLGSAVMAETSGSDTTSVSTTGAAALITGLDIDVAAGSSKTITAKLVLNDIGSGAAASQQNLALTMDSVRYSDTNGTVATSSTNRAANEIRAYNSIPTVSAVDLTNSTLVNGQASDLYKFTITANSNGSVAIKQIKFPMTWTDGESNNDTLEMESWKLYKNGTDISTSSSAVVISDEDGNSVESTSGALEADGTLNVIWDTNEEVISAGETVTYILRATPQSFDNDSDTGDEDYFSIYLAGDASHNSSGGTAALTDVCLDDQTSGEIWQLGDTAAIGTACTTTATNSSDYNFIWSDMSGESHDASGEAGSGDWANGYLVLSLDLSGETWSK